MKDKSVKKTTRRTESSMKVLEKALKLGIKYGVSELKLGDTHVIFGEVSKQPRKPRKAASKLEKEQLVVQEDKAQLQMQFKSVQDDIETAHILDPLAYEEAIAAGQLIDETRIENSGPQ